MVWVTGWAIARMDSVNSGGWRRPFSSLRVRMVLIFAGVLVVTLALASGVSGFITHAALYSHDEIDRNFQERRLSRFAANWHDAHRSWERLDTAVAGIGPALGREVIILDNDGKVVANSGRGKRRDDDFVVATRLSLPATETVAISDDSGDTIGYLLIKDPSEEPFAPPAVALVQQNVTKSLLIGGLTAGLAGVVIVGLMATRVLGPLAQLNRAALRFGRGELSQRVPVSGPAELKGLATAFNTMAEDLERSDSQRRHMTADVAHELRTPLSNIRGYLEAIKDGVLPADEATIDTLHQQSTHLSQLVDDLALLARAEAGALSLEFQTVPLSPILEAVVEAFRPRAAAAGVNLELEIADGLPDVTVDATRVAQIIGNLVDNAVVHTPAGGTVTVAASASADVRTGEGTVYVSVTDTGAGIAPDDLEQIFDRFFRTDPSRSRATGGSGLGLTIARQLAVAHGGALTAESTLGKGSRFICALPTTRAE